MDENCLQFETHNNGQENGRQRSIQGIDWI